MRVIEGCIAVLIGVAILYCSFLRVGVVSHRIVDLGFNLSALLSFANIMVLSWGWAYWMFDIAGALCMPFVKVLRLSVERHQCSVIRKSFGCGVVYILIWMIVIMQFFYVGKRISDIRDFVVVVSLISEVLIWLCAYLVTGMHVTPRSYFIMKFIKNEFRFKCDRSGELYFLIIGAIVLLINFFCIAF